MNQWLYSLNRQKEQAQSLVEYALILVLVAVIVIVILSVVGTSISGILCTVQGVLNGGYFNCGQCSPISYSGDVPIGGQRNYRMDFAQGDVVTLFVQGRGDNIFDPTVTLLDPSGNQVGYDDDSGEVDNNGSARLVYTVPANGIYTFRIEEYTDIGGSLSGYIRCS